GGGGVLRPGDVGELVNVGAGEEGARLGAGDDEAADAGLGGDAVQRGGEVGEGLAAQDVQTLAGHVEPQEGGVVLNLHPEVVRLKERHAGVTPSVACRIALAND